MMSIRLVLVFILSINSQQIFQCDFDYGLKCLPGLPSASFVLLNETSEQPRQPPSDVTAIETSNDQGECFFPFQLNSFEMFFCEKTDPDLPATCPTFNSTGPTINCSDGEYGYEQFEIGEIGSREYKLDLNRDLLSGEHCIRFFYYLSDENSNASVQVIIEDSLTSTNTTIVTASARLQNRWHEIRDDFYLDSDKPIVYFQFERGSSSDLFPFYIGIDQITITDVECGPMNTTTITTTDITTTTTTQSTTSISSSTTISVTTSTSTSTLTSTSINPTTTSTSLSITMTTSSTTTSVTQSSTTTSTISVTTVSTTITLSSSTSTSSTTTTTTTERSSSIKIRSNIFLMILFPFLLMKQLEKFF